MRVVVRISGSEKTIVRGRRPNRSLAALGAALALPLAWFCFAVCAWRWCYELSWTRQFLVTEGVWTHWQVWFLAGGLVQGVTVLLGRYAGSAGPEQPGVSTP